MAQGSVDEVRAHQRMARLRQADDGAEMCVDPGTTLQSGRTVVALQVYLGSIAGLFWV